MAPSKWISRSLLAGAAVAALTAALLQPADAVEPALGGSVAAVPSFLAALPGVALATPPAAPPTPVLGVGSSVMPPGPQPGQACSTMNSANPCSALTGVQRCSAFNDNGNQCSTLPNPSPGGPQQCSTAGQNAACTVLPPSAGANPSQCSTFNGSNFPASCSALGQAERQQCSTKGAGLSQCSAFPNAQARCSVLNSGTNQRSFCSTKFNQPTIAKNCSAFAVATECSVLFNGRGVCTSFGMALPASCSAFASGSHCSVIGGMAGNPCAQ